MLPNARAEPEATSSPPASAAATEPAPPSERQPGSLVEAFRADPDGVALKARGRGAQDDDQADGAAPPEASAPAERDAALSQQGASKSGADAAVSPSGLSRRGAAAAIADRDAEIERLVAERTAERERTQHTEAKLAEVEGRQDAARRAVLGRIGDDQDFADLSAKRLHGQVMSYEEDERLNTMIDAREDAAIYWELAERGHRAGVARGLAGRAEKYGLDRDRAFEADVVGLLDHAVEVTEARVRRESADRIAELEAELKGLRPVAAASRRAAPTVGGTSAGSGAMSRLPEDGASPMDWFRAGDERRAREAAAARGARRVR